MAGGLEFLDESSARVLGENTRALFLETGTFATRPAKGRRKGHVWFAWDTNTLYIWNGSSWLLVATGSETYTVKVSIDDSTDKYLEGALAAGTGISLATINPGANEQVRITSTVTGLVEHDNAYHNPDFEEVGVAVGLIAAHAAIAAAHHARYTDAEVDARVAALAVLKTLFDATTFLYATADNTPQPKTRAEVMALLSGQAAADFAMNTHKITGVVDPAADQDAATKKYVDDNTGSVELWTAVTPQTLTAGSTITVTDGEPWCQIDSASAITLTSAPHIAAGRNGQVVYLHNTGSYNITLQDVNALGGSLMRFTANTLTIQPAGTLGLVYDSDVGFWVQTLLLNPQTFTPSISSFTSDLAATREVATGSVEDTAPNFTIAYVGTPSACEIDVSAGGDPATKWPISVPSPYTALNGGTTPPTDTFLKATSIGGTRVFTATATVAGQGGLQKTLTFTYYNNRFVGNNAKDKTAALTEAEIEALATVAISNSKTGSWSVVGGGNYLWFCYPSRLGAALYASIQGEIADWNDRGVAVTVTNPSGYAETFQQWCSGVTVAGAVTLAVSTSIYNNRFYMGPSTDTDPISNANILALDDTADGESGVYSSQARTWTAIKIEAGEYLWYCHPDRVADLATIKDGTTGFAIAGSYRTNVSHTNQYGYVEDYRCWRSDNPGIYPAGENIVVT